LVNRLAVLCSHEQVGDIPQLVPRWLPFQISHSNIRCRRAHALQLVGLRPVAIVDLGYSEVHGCEPQADERIDRLFDERNRCQAHRSWTSWLLDPRSGSVKPQTVSTSAGGGRAG